MKKNKMLRLASVLLVLTMLTTSIIGGTFAKYTTTGNANDTARVAKWGVAITTSGSLYSDAYANATVKDNGNLPAAWIASPDAKTITVAAAKQNDNIVAPGTKSYGKGLSFGISGTPEVAVTVGTTIKAEDIFLKNGTYGVLVPATVSDTESLKKVVNAHTDGVYGLKNDTYSKVEAVSASYEKDTTYYILTEKTALKADYFPVKYKLAGTTTGTEKTAVEVADTLAKAIKTGAEADTGKTGYKADYSNISSDFKANTDLSKDGPKFGKEDLTWEWDFSDTDADPKDTILGDLIAARGNDAPGYVVVSVGTDGAVTALTIASGDEDYTVKAGNDVVANLRTMFDISLSVTQID